MFACMYIFVHMHAYRYLCAHVLVHLNTSIVVHTYRMYVCVHMYILSHSHHKLSVASTLSWREVKDHIFFVTHNFILMHCHQPFYMRCDDLNFVPEEYDTLYKERSQTCICT